MSILGKNIFVIMQNRKIKNENQVILFDLIRKTWQKNIALVDEVSELLGLGTTATYRRMRGDKPISLEETVKLCRHFNISMDSLVGVTHKNHIQCRYAPLNLSDITDFITFVQVSSNNFEDTRLTPGGEIILSAVDVPIFNILPYKELTLFKLFSWSKSVYDFTADYETFVNEVEKIESLNKNYEIILNSYHLVPSTEIWTDSTIDAVLRLLSYHSEMKHFSDDKIPVTLCEQLLDLIDTLQKWAEKGTKGSKDTSFKFYVSETYIANTFILFKKGKKTNCLIKLYTINGLGISDERFCKETENWLQKSIQQATLISGASEKERFKFFSGQRKKVTDLIDKIQSDFRR